MAEELLVQNHPVSTTTGPLQAPEVPDNEDDNKLGDDTNFSQPPTGGAENGADWREVAFKKLTRSEFFGTGDTSYHQDPD